MARWFNARAGTDSVVLSVRATEQEHARVDDLRRQFHLKSKGQVLRLALDVLEAFIGSTDVTPAQRQETLDVMASLRKRLELFPTEQNRDAAPEPEGAKRRRNADAAARVAHTKMIAR